MFESVKSLIEEHQAVQEELSDPALHADAARSKRVNRRYAELSRIVAAYDAWVRQPVTSRPPGSSPRRTRLSPTRCRRSKSASKRRRRSSGAC